MRIYASSPIASPRREDLASLAKVRESLLCVRLVDLYSVISGSHSLHSIGSQLTDPRCSFVYREKTLALLSLVALADTQFYERLLSVGPPR